MKLSLSHFEEAPIVLRIHNLVSGGFCECRKLVVVLSWAMVALRYLLLEQMRTFVVEIIEAP
jgi:hypothetical protein